jgi:ABC-2 type transport system permease protein
VTVTPVTSLRVFLFGGMTSYRALFNWLSPWILVPTFLVTPVTQILLFVYIGRGTGTGSDEFFVVGNALQYGAVPCLFASAGTINEERRLRTLSIVLTTPARRLPLILGRSLPVFLNGFAVSAFALLVGGAVVGVRLRTGTLGPVALATAASAFSCTGLGLISGAIGLRARQTVVLSSCILGLLLVFCGINVPLDDLPVWMVAVADWLPLTHGVEAARALAGGAGLRDVAGLLLTEVGLGAGYLVLGLIALHVFERQSRRTGSLERA